MSSSNLTETQKQLLQWLVEQVRSGKLNEEDILCTEGNFGSSGISVADKTGQTWELKDTTKTTFHALCENKFLSCTPTKKDNYHCALTQKAYDAVDSNFDAPNLSAIHHLIPLTEVKHLDSELLERCNLLSSRKNDPKAWDNAVRTAVVILEERLRKLGNTESINADATGEAIVNLIFAGKDPILKDKLEDKKLKAYRDLYAGIMSVFRNPYAHRIQDPSPEVGGAIIVFIDLLLKMLDDIDWD